MSSHARSRTPVAPTSAGDADAGGVDTASGNNAGQEGVGNAARAGSLEAGWAEASGEVAANPAAAADGFLGLQGDARSDGDDRAAAAYDRGVMLERTGDLEGAVIAYEEAWVSVDGGEAGVSAGRALDRLRPQVGVFGARQDAATVEGAIQLAEAHRWDEALAAFEASQAHRRGQDPYIQFNLAMCYAHTGQRAEATAMFASLLDARGLDADVRANAESELTRLRGGQMPAQVDPDAAPDTTEAFTAMLDRAVDALAHGRVGESLALHLSLAESPVIGDARGAVAFNQGILWSRLGVKARAVGCFQDALDSGQLDPGGAAEAERRIAQLGGPPPRA